MDKYSVVLDDELTKTGSKGSSCPNCGSTLERQGYCNTCGTEPFEKRPVPQEQPPKK